MADTVGSLTIKILFEGNHPEFFKDIEKSVKGPDKAVDDLLAKGGRLATVFNEENTQLKAIIEAFKQKSAAVDAVKKSFDGLRDSIEPASERMKRLTADLAADNLTIKERIAAEKELQKAIESVATDQEMLNGSYRRELETIERSIALRKEMKALASSGGAVDPGAGDGQSVEHLTALMQQEQATIEQLSEAVKASTATFKENFSAQDRASESGQAFARVIADTKTRIAEATSVLLSQNGKLMQSYFSNGDALRKMALDGGGYVTSLQVQQMAADLAAKGNLSLADAMELVRAKMAEANVQTKDFTVSIDRSSQAAEEEAAASSKSTEAIEAQRRATEGLTGAKTEEVKATERASAAGEESTKKRAAYTSQEIGLIEQLRIDLGDLRIALDQATDPKQVARLNAELRATERELEKMTGRGVKGIKRDFENASFQINRTHQALFALSFLMSTYSTENASKEQQKFTRALSAGTNTALGVTFALQSLGKTFTGIAGPIGLVIGVVTALVSAMSSANEEARKAAQEGLSQFVAKLASVSGADLSVLRSALADMRALGAEGKKFGEATKSISFGFSSEDMKRSLKELRDGAAFAPLPPTMPFSTAQGDVTASVARKALVESLKTENEERKKTIDELEKEINKQEVLNEFQRKANAIIREHGSRLQVIRIDIEEMTKQVQNGNLSLEERRKIIDQIAALTREGADLLKSTDQLTAEAIQREEERVRLGRSNHENYIRVLEQAKLEIQDKTLLAGLEEKILAAREARIALMESQIDLGDATIGQVREELQKLLETEASEERRLAIKKQILDLTDREVNAPNAALAAIQQAKIDTTTNPMQRRRLEEQKRHDEALALIEKQYGEEAALADNAEQAEIHRNERLRLEAIRTAQETETIERDSRDRIQQLKVDNIDDDLRRIIAQYDLEETLLKDSLERQEIAQEEYIERLKRLQTDRQRDFARAWLDSEVVARAAIEGVGASFRQMWGSVMVSNRQAVNAQDAAWLTLRNTALSAIGDVLARELESLIVSTAAQETASATKTAISVTTAATQTAIAAELAATQTALAVATIATTTGAIMASMAAITAAASSAATLVSIATLGGAAVTGGLAVVQALALVRAASFISALNKGGKVGGSGSGGETEVEPGSFVVNEAMSAKYKPLLDILGAREVTGGIPHEDSVVAKAGAGAVVLTPKERILPPAMAPLGELLNQGKFPDEHMGVVVKAMTVADRKPHASGSLVLEVPGLAASLTGSDLPELLQRQTGGIVGNEMRMSQAAQFLRSASVAQTIVHNSPTAVNSTIDTSALVAEIRELRRETQRVGTILDEKEMSVEFPDKIKADFKNGEMWLRDEFPKAQKFHKRKTA